MTKATVRINPEHPYPVELNPYGDGERYLLSVEEAEYLNGLLTDALIDHREARQDYVQVKFLGSGQYKTYTYTAPKGMLKVGDLVEVPTRYGTQVAQVDGFGKNYSGNILAVSARLHKTVLS